MPELPQLTRSISGVFCAISGVVAAVFVIAKLSRRHNLDAIPTVGSSTWLGSWWAGLKYLNNGVDVIQEGYEKHKGAPFKIADRLHWTVIVSSREHVEELLRAPEDELSFVEATNDRLNTRYTLGDDLHDRQYHLGAIRNHLSRNIATLYPEIRDEIVTAFDELLDFTGEEWKSVQALPLIQNVVCRTSNRLFVGLPLCRDPDWIDLNIKYTIDVSKAGILLALFPKFLRPLAVLFFTGVAEGIVRGLRHLRPIIERRLGAANEHGNEEVEKPNDLVSWLMEEAKGPPLTLESLATRILFINITAILTSSNCFGHSLLYLAGNPHHIQPLREEVETIVEKEGWSKASLSKMRKVDSFIKECQRLEGMSAIAVVRKALKDYTFSDGTFMPKGTIIGVASRPLHYEERFYKDPNVFNPFRFTEMHVDDDEVKSQFVSTSTEYLVFGHGKHACPGRFFAANELKTMLAHMILTYDMKLEDGATRPPSLHFGTSIIVDSHAKVLFRKRIR